MPGVFASQEEAVATLRSGWLNIPMLEGVELDDAYLAQNLAAAEEEVEHALRVFLSPTAVLPESATQEERDALDTAGQRWVEEPGYDMEPEFFQGERWGYLISRSRPIISVSQMTFVYPTPTSDIFDVPIEWIRVDKKYGHIRLVPGAQAFAAPMAAWVIRVMGGGRTIPHMIQLRYIAGLTNVATRYPAILNVVQRIALLRILQSRFMPSSGSISADGLSESMSVDLSKHQADINAELERIRTAIHGIEMIVI